MKKTFGVKNFSKKRKENFRIRRFIFEFGIDKKAFQKDGLGQRIFRGEIFFGGSGICIGAVSYQH